MTPELIASIKAGEGLRLQAYPDPVSGRDPITIGWGHTGPDVHLGLVWTEDQCEAALDADIAHAIALCDRHMPWWADLNQARRDVLAELVYNLGWGDGSHGLSSFHNTLRLVEDGKFSAAAQALLASKWATQVGARATRLAEQLRTGVRA